MVPVRDERSDEALLERWAAGEEAAGSDLVHRHIETLHRFFATRVDLHSASDLAQRTFLACVESRARLPVVASFRAFLLGIARHELLDHFRRTARAVPGVVPVAEAGPRTFGTALAMRQEQRLLLAALRKLPFELQLALELYYWEELDTAEIAGVLEIPRGTVMSRLHRARQLLARSIRAMEAGVELVDSTLHGLETWARSLRDIVPRHEHDEGGD
jgi:RNA polymerase sigma-70 factor (ECF subfamily)